MECPVTVGEVIDAKYRVDRIIATGGMGVVVEARHLDLDQRVAIKFLRATAVDADATAARLRREARVAARIRSQHAARIFDVGTLRGSVPYMVMEYLEGNDLADELADWTRLPVQEAVHHVLQAIEALAEAHAAGIVHRDVKPENLFLALRPDGTRTLKLLDFGISKWEVVSTLPELTLHPSAILGSPPYMSPEQLRDADSVDQRADIWSLGAILYELVSGRQAFTGRSVPEICAAVLESPPRRLRELDPALPEALDRAVMRCLAKDPERRFATVAELAEALLPFAPNARVYVKRAQRVLTGVPISDRATPAPPAPDAVRPSSPSSRARFPTIPTATTAVARAPGPLRETGIELSSKPARARRLGIVLAALAGTVFGIAAWTVSSARGALDADVPARTVTAPIETAAPSPPEPAAPTILPPAPASTATHEVERPRPRYVPRPKRTTRPRRAPRPAPTTAPLSVPSPLPETPVAPASSSDVTDFGGRR